MRTPSRKLLLLSASIFASTAPIVEAQEDPNNKIMKEIYSKIVGAIDMRRSTLDNTNNKYFFVITQPGIFVDPKLIDDEGKENVELKRVFSEVVDRIMLPSWVYGPVDQTYNEYFATILRSYDYSPLALPDSKKEELKKAKSLLFTDELDDEGIPKETSSYAAYIALEDKYNTALGSAQEWLNTNPGKVKYPPKLETSIKNAMTKWEFAGKKQEIDDARETVERYDPAGYWSEVRTKFKKTDDSLPLHNYYPSIATWLDEKNKWPSLSVAWSKSETHNYNHQTSASGGGSFSVGGFFSVGGGANYSRINTIEQNEATKIDIKFEYLRVDFRRPWLSRIPFSDRRWRFACGTEPEVNKDIISSGPQPDAGGIVQYPNGKMPMIPTGFLIVRNATMTGNFSKSFKEYYKQVISASKSAGFGPFSVRGSYNDTTEKTDVDATVADNGFTVGNPQIIGFFTEVLPSSPNPLPDLFEACSSDPK
ncbi:hypothetical protein [Rhizobium leguminosarum]|uniref:hypothetical protein n=1 Tax=Rhizobium leguminosarum TaxID=384 RepID=UPI00103120E8|nr:hypothetical protein [Rhizobium leguminosarum]TBF65686.1 hypothetical protein ELG89_34595 [Rhizobium leguminosarum]